MKGHDGPLLNWKEQYKWDKELERDIGKVF